MFSKYASNCDFGGLFVKWEMGNDELRIMNYEWGWRMEDGVWGMGDSTSDYGQTTL